MVTPASLALRTWRPQDLELQASLSHRGSYKLVGACQREREERETERQKKTDLFTPK